MYNHDFYFPELAKRITEGELTRDLPRRLTRSARVRTGTILAVLAAIVSVLTVAAFRFSAYAAGTALHGAYNPRAVDLPMFPQER